MRFSPMSPKMSQNYRTPKDKPVTDFTTSPKDVEEVAPLFNDLFVGVLYQSVDPQSCITFTNITQTSDLGGEKLICLFGKTFV